MAGSAVRTNSQRPAAGRKGKGPPAAQRGARPSVLGRVFARPGVIVAGATFAAVMTGIVANALLFQKGHHASPLFTPAPAVAPAEPAPVPAPAQRQVIEAPAPAEVQKPAAPEPAAPEAPAPKTKPAHVAAKPGVKPVHKAAAPHRDLIGDLLNKQGH